MGFLFGIPRKLIKRITEIETDTNYYDKDVIPSNQNIFTYTVDENTRVATITGLRVFTINDIVIPYRVKYGQDVSELYADVKLLKNNALANNSTLRSVTFPNTINVIPDGFLQNNSNLETVDISKSIHTISKKAFYNCDKLKSVFIPHSVVSIGENAFGECDNIKLICYKDSIAEKYAIENDIPYSLISYTLDDDITENSPNLVTSGVIWTNIQKIYNRIIEVVNTLNNRITTVNTDLSNKISNGDTNLSNKIDDVNNNLVNEINEIESLIDSHIDNKSNPHDDSTFNNSILIGNTIITKGSLTEVSDDEDSLVNKEYVDKTIADSIKNIDVSTDGNIGEGYQKIYDSGLETEIKTVTGAINEVNDRVNHVDGKLIAGWNTVSLKKKYPLSWSFLNKPFCYTDEGISVDYRVKDLNVSNETIINNENTFSLYVPIDCNYSLSTTAKNEIAGYPIEYLVLSYYYTGSDGDDLDTVTGISNDNWPLQNKTVGYKHSTNITNNADIKLIHWGGDNTGGGSSAANDKFYESIYFDIKHIQEQLPHEDVEVILYGTWYAEMGNKNIHISIDAYTCDEIPTITDNSSTKRITLSGTNLVNTYSNTDLATCNIVTYKGDPTNYENAYTPAFKIIFKQTVDGSDYRTVIVQPLS